MTAAAPSATVVPLRAGRVLLLRRRGSLAFHGGAWVFPGGRTDAGESHEDCAVREAREEAALDLDGAALVPLAHWTTPVGRPRRYATWFYLAAVESPRFTVDGGEILEGRWWTPAEALAARDAGEIALPPPTFVTLKWLDGAPDPIGVARATEPPRILPRPRALSAGHVSILPGDVAYDGARLDAAGPRHRSWLVEEGWRYECTTLPWNGDRVGRLLG